MSDLSHVKEGEEVAMRIGMSDSFILYPVTSINPKGIIQISTGAKFRPDGSPLAKTDKWGVPAYIQPVTDEIRQAIRKNMLIGRLSRLDYNQWKGLSLAKLEALVALLDQEE